MKRFSYGCKPIGSIKALAAALGVSVDQVTAVARDTRTFYKESNNPSLFKNGEKRLAYIVRPQLAMIHDRIVDRILRFVVFPEYLFGGIKGRSYIENAKKHVGSSVVLCEDVESFFSSIRAVEVKKIWQYFFKFPPEVADVLTALTTLNGRIPQGARTSTYLANLVLWDVEPQVVERLEVLGLTYTRFIDDITVSSKARISKQELLGVKSEIARMLARKRLRRNNRKSKVLSKGEPMSITGLNTNAGRPTVSKIKRSNIRSAINDLGGGRFIERAERTKLVQRVRGHISSCSLLHPEQMKRNTERLLRKKTEHND